MKSNLLKNIIKNSKITYLKKDRKRELLSDLGEDDLINDKIKNILNGGDLSEYSENNDIYYDDCIVLSNLCSDYEDFIEFMNKITLPIFINSINLKLIVFNSKDQQDFIKNMDNDNILDLISLFKTFSTLEIKNILKNYKSLGFNNLSWSSLLTIGQDFLKYKQDGFNEIYLGGFNHSGAYNILDIYTDITYIDGKQEKGKSIVIGEQSFFTVNNKGKNLDQQHIINRLFAPFLSMTRLIRIINGKEILVSIDVYDENAENILKTKIDTPDRINDILRIIYQFIALDEDRLKFKGRAITDNSNLENDIILDFDFILSDVGNFYLGEDEIDFELSSLDEKQKLELSNILYFFREYIIKFSNEELKNIDKTDLNYNFFNIIKNQAQNLCLMKILTGIHEVSNRRVSDKDFKIGIEIDNMLVKKYTKED